MKKIFLLLNLMLFPVMLTSCNELYRDDYDGENQTTPDVKPEVTVTSVTITGKSNFIFGHNHTIENRRFTAIVLGENDPSEDVIWSVSDDSIATIDLNGIITVINYGEIVIKATSVVDTEVYGYLSVRIEKTDAFIAATQVVNLILLLPQVTEITLNNYDVAYDVLTKIKTIIEQFIGFAEESLFAGFVSKFTGTSIFELIQRMNDTTYAIDNARLEAENRAIIMQYAYIVQGLILDITNKENVNLNNFLDIQTTLNEIINVLDYFNDDFTAARRNLFLKYVYEMTGVKLLEFIELTQRKIKVAQGQMTHQILIEKKANETVGLIEQLAELDEITFDNFVDAEEILSNILYITKSVNATSRTLFLDLILEISGVHLINLIQETQIDIVKAQEDLANRLIIKRYAKQVAHIVNILLDNLDIDEITLPFVMGLINTIDGIKGNINQTHKTLFLSFVYELTNTNLLELMEEVQDLISNLN